jgi:hypothetical protein
MREKSTAYKNSAMSEEKLPKHIRYQLVGGKYPVNPDKPANLAWWKAVSPQPTQGTPILNDESGDSVRELRVSPAAIIGRMDFLAALDENGNLRSKNTDETE